MPNKCVHLSPLFTSAHEIKPPVRKKSNHGNLTVTNSGQLLSAHRLVNGAACGWFALWENKRIVMTHRLCWCISEHFNSALHTSQPIPPNIIFRRIVVKRQKDDRQLLWYSLLLIFYNIPVVSPRCRWGCGAAAWAGCEWGPGHQEAQQRDHLAGAQRERRTPAQTRDEDQDEDQQGGGGEACTAQTGEGHHFRQI